MTAPTTEMMGALRAIEMRPGADSYGVDMGHLIMPNGSLIAVWQADDELAAALVKAYREEVLERGAVEGW